MASQPTADVNNSYIPPRKITGKPKLLLMTPAVAEKVIQIANEIKPDGRSQNTERPNFKAPWLEKYRAPQWQKGQTANPLGRGAGRGAPAFRKMAEAYKEIAEMVDPETGLTYGHLVALAQFHNAIEQQSVTSAKEIREAIDGKLLSDATPGDLLENESALRAKILQKLFYSETSIEVTVVPVRPITSRKVLNG